jgi:hypothetical protein
VFLYLALYHIKETEYFAGEDDVVVPKHVLEEHGYNPNAGNHSDEEKRPSPAVSEDMTKNEKKAASID